MKETVGLANEAQSEKILQEFELRSEQIKDEGFVESEYSAYEQRMLPEYLYHV